MSEIINYIEHCNEMIKNNKPKGYYYNNVYDFLLKEGRMFKSEPLTVNEKEAVNDIFDSFISIHGEPQYRECYFNAQMALIFDYNNLFRYSEGLAMSDVGLIINHGFLTINNKVVDLTWRDSNGDFYIGEKANEYFGVRFDSDDIFEVISDLKTAVSHLECWWSKNLIYKKKFNDSQPYYAVNSKKKPPLSTVFFKKD